MAKTSLTSLTVAQRLLLGIVTSVEAGLTTPEDAVAELTQLKSEAVPEFKGDYTLADFEKIRSDYVSNYESSSALIESSESSW